MKRQAQGERHRVDSQLVRSDLVGLWPRRIMTDTARSLRLCPSTLRTSAKVNVGHDLANGPHLTINDAI
jgi:hypothetical protein